MYILVDARVEGPMDKNMCAHRYIGYVKWTKWHKSGWIDGYKPDRLYRLIYRRLVPKSQWV